MAIRIIRNGEFLTDLIYDNQFGILMLLARVVDPVGL